MSFQNCKVVAAGVDPEAYHRTDVPRGDPDFPINNSMLGIILPCPKKFIDGFEPAESKAKETGSLFDTLLLSASQFDNRYVEEPDFYSVIGMECPNCGSVTDAKTCRACKCDRVPTTIQKPWDRSATVCKEWKSQPENKDRDAVKPKEVKAAKTAVEAVHADQVLSEMLAGAETQVMVAGEWKDRATGLVIPVKALLDIVPSVTGEWKKYLYDYKTCRSAATAARRRDTFTYGYARQAAFFSDIYCSATGEDRCVFCHIAQENYPPFHVEKDMLSSEFLEIGRRQYTFALSLYCSCLATGQWEGYYAQDYIDGHRLIQPEPWMTIAGDYRILAAPAAAGEVADEYSNEDVVP